MVRATVDPVAMVAAVQARVDELMARGVSFDEALAGLSGVELPPGAGPVDGPAPGVPFGAGGRGRSARIVSFLFQGGPGGGSGVGLGSGPGGESGDFSASAFELNEFSVGEYTGSFETSYEIPVPSSSAGPSPSVSFSYSSASIDGMTDDTNNQSGPLGVGWSFGQGSVRLSFDRCYSADYVEFVAGNPDFVPTGDYSAESDDLLGPYVLTLNGVTSELVWVGSVLFGEEYRLQDDPTWRVFRVNDTTPGSLHPDFHNHYWVVETPDGMTYRFGGEYDTAGRQLRSAQWVPVRDPAADPTITLPAELPDEWCNDPAFSDDGYCPKVYQWNLDLVTDVTGNTATYFYEAEGNSSTPW